MQMELLVKSFNLFLHDHLFWPDAFLARGVKQLKLNSEGSLKIIAEASARLGVAFHAIVQRLLA